MKLTRWLTTLAYAGFIFYLSSRTWRGPPLFPDADKIVHFFLYFVFAALFVWSFRATSLRDRLEIFPLSAAAAAIYGVTDEIHQIFIPGRTADLSDWIADAAGAVIGAWIATMMARRFSKNVEE